MSAEIVPFPSPKPAEAEVQMISLEALFRGMMAGEMSFADLKRNQAHENDLDRLRKLDVRTLRTMWDEVGDDSYYHGPHGEADCSDIHRVLNEKGDGYYCAV